MGKQITHLIDTTFDELHWELVRLGLRKETASTTWDFFILLLGFSFLVCALPVFNLLTFAKSPHVVFWLGDEPREANLLVPTVLLIIAIAMPCLKCMSPSQRVVRISVFLLFFVGGVAIAAGGLHVVLAAHNVSANLVYRCGAPELTSGKIEAEWRRLDAFYRSCVSESGSRRMKVQQCPGYVGMLASAHEDYVTYLQAVEADFSCSGFCRFWAQPLFTVDSEAGRRCASAVGEEVVNTGYFIGLPTMLSGAALVGLGFGLAGYDHL